MIQSGIHNIKQLSRKNLDGFWPRRQSIALDLYAHLEELEPQKRDYVGAKILARFTTGDGIFKYTFSNRFDDFDKKCFPFIKEHCAANAPLHVHDIGVSDGRSTMPFFLGLQEYYEDKLDYLASDYSPHVFSVQKKTGGKTRLILDSDGSLLQIIYPPFVLNMGRKEKTCLYPLNHLLRLVLMPLFVNKLLRLYRDNKEALSIKKIDLIAYECQEQLKKCDNFHFEQYNIFEPSPKKYKLIRVMNLLNKSYFSDKDLKIAVHNTFESLDDGGMFISGSNMEAGTTVNGGIYKKENGKMICLYSSGEGFAIHDMVMNIEKMNMNGK